MKSQLIYLKKFELNKELDNFDHDHFFAIADQKVKNHLPQWIQFSPNVFWLKSPEEQKNIEVYASAIDFFLGQGIQRDSVLYSFGGGATTDFSGFVASTILRGIDWVAIPTTLLAMVDGSIGGKVALNTSHGKNLIGAYHSPKTIYVCNEFLSTLTAQDYLSGKGEILKYGFLSKEISEMILSKRSIEDILVECAKYKLSIVEKDFKDTKERILLNLGHTMGHAFESTLQIPHGYAVIMGMKYLFQVMKLTDLEQFLKEMLKALELVDLNLDVKDYPTFSSKIFFKYLEQDKKKLKSVIRLVLVKEVGSCYIEEVPLKEFKTKIMKHADFKDK